MMPALALAVVLAMVAAACGNGESADDAADDPAESSDSDDGADDPEPDDEGLDAAEYYDGERITFIVPAGAGGGFDNYTRFIAEYLGPALNATIEVDNRGGGGGIPAYNDLAEAEPDGLTLAIMNPGGVAQAILSGEDADVRFELADIEYLANFATAEYMLGAGAPSGVTTYEELTQQTEFRFASVGVGSATHFTSLLIQDVLGLEGGTIPGFENVPDAALAAAAGEVGGVTGPWATLSGQIDSGDVIPLASWTRERSIADPDVPTIFELVEGDDEAEQLFGADVDIQSLFRSIVAPPGTDPVLVDHLRQVMEDIAADQEFLDAAEAQGFPIDFMTGEQVAATVPDLLDPPDAYRQILIDAVEEN